MNISLTRTGLIRLLMTTTPLLLVSMLASPLQAQDYVPGIGMVEEDEWYDPSDWFDGNELETEDIYGQYGDYEYDYNYETNQYVVDEREETATDYYENELLGDELYDDSIYQDEYYEDADDYYYYDDEYGEEYYDNLYTSDWYEEP